MREFLRSCVQKNTKRGRFFHNLVDMFSESYNFVKMDFCILDAFLYIKVLSNMRSSLWRPFPKDLESHIYWLQLSFFRTNHSDIQWSDYQKFRRRIFRRQKFRRQKFRRQKFCRQKFRRQKFCRLKIRRQNYRRRWLHFIKRFSYGFERKKFGPYPPQIQLVSYPPNTKLFRHSKQKLLGFLKIIFWQKSKNFPWNKLELYCKATDRTENIPSLKRRLDELIECN